MTQDDKKRVALGTTLALLLGAGSYWVLGSGGGSGSGGLNSSPRSPKVIRVTSTVEPKNHVGNRRPKRHQNELNGGKTHRVRADQSGEGKKQRGSRHQRVTRKRKEPKPAA